MKFQVKNLYGIYFLEGLGVGSVTLPVISHTLVCKRNWLGSSPYVNFCYFKIITVALPSVSQLVECHLLHRKVTGSIPG